METKKTNLFNSLKRSLQAISVAAVAIGFIACNKSNNSGSSSSSPVSSPYNNYNLGMQNCVGCQTMTNGGGTLVQVVGTTGTGAAQMNLDVLGNVNGVNPYATNYITSYVGPVALQGSLIIQSPQALGYMCPVPPGQYQVSTLAAGQMSAGIISGVELQAMGPVMLQIRVGASTLYGVSGGGMQPRIGMAMALVSINGQPCSSGTIQTF